MKTVMIDGVEYVPASECKQRVTNDDSFEYVMVRTQNAGVFAGYLKEEEGERVVLTTARRIWYWAGAASLSQLAQSGTSKPESCKFPEAVSELRLTQVIEIIPITATAKATIDAVAVWKS